MIILGSSKAGSGFRISVKWTFFRYVLRLRRYERGATSEYRFKIGDFAPTGTVWPKISGRMGRPHHYFSQKTKLNELSYDIKLWTYFFVLSQFTRLTDGRTGRILIARPRLLSMQRDKNRPTICQSYERMYSGSFYTNGHSFGVIARN